MSPPASRARPRTGSLRPRRSYRAETRAVGRTQGRAGAAYLGGRRGPRTTRGDGDRPGGSGDQDLLAPPPLPATGVEPPVVETIRRAAPRLDAVGNQVDAPQGIWARHLLRRLVGPAQASRALEEPV